MCGLRTCAPLLNVVVVGGDCGKGVRFNLWPVVTVIYFVQLVFEHRLRHIFRRKSTLKPLFTSSSSTIELGQFELLTLSLYLPLSISLAYTLTFCVLLISSLHPVYFHFKCCKSVYLLLNPIYIIYSDCCWRSIIIVTGRIIIFIVLINVGKFVLATTMTSGGCYFFFCVTNCFVCFYPDFTQLGYEWVGCFLPFFVRIFFRFYFVFVSLVLC